MQRTSNVILCTTKLWNNDTEKHETCLMANLELKKKKSNGTDLQTRL